MQVTIIHKVIAQVIHGPANHTYVNPISPFIKYHWDITGVPPVVVTYSGLNLANGAVDEKADINWDWINLPANPEIKIIEEPIYPLLVADPLYPYLPVDLLGEVTLDPPAGPGLSDNVTIQGAINAMKAHIDITGMTGTVRFPTPPAGVVSYTYLIEEILLAHGVRLVGSGQGATILQRFIAAPPANPTYRKMLNTNYAPNNWTNWYTFLPKIDNLNSKPIEISGMTIDGVVTIDVNNPTPNAWEQSALIWLEAPHEKVAAGGIYVQELNENLHGYCGAATDPNGSPPNNTPNNACYQSLGSGKLKVFIHDVEFKNSRSDAVSQLENVDLNMHHCTGHDIYRGTYTLTGGAAKARLKDISTSTTAGILTKAVDLEGDHLGYGGIRKFRLWMDNCQFDKNVQLDFRCSNILMTNTDIGHQPTTIIGYSHGDIVTNNCTLPFLRVHGETPNFIMAPKHAKFNNTTFLFESPTPAPLDVPVDGCFNGLYYKNHSVINIGTQQNPIWQDVYYKDAHIGFNNCTFTDAMTISYPQKYGFYVFDHPTQLATQNHAENLQLYFNNNTVANTFTSQNIPILYTASCPTTFATNFAPGVINNNEIYTGGESEDEMKTHFGIRKLDLDEFPCNPSLVNNNSIDKWDNPKASEIIAHYNNNVSNEIDGKEIYINGTFTIDVDISFINNCIIWFTQTGKVKLVGASTFDVDESILQAACDWWLGIEADDPQQKVKIENLSHIKNAIRGAYILNDAIIEASNSFFEDNGFACIAFKSLSTNNYAGYVLDNTFTSGNALPAPYVKTERGIQIEDVNHINIGDASVGNTFDGMQCGIFISESRSTGSEHIGLYNNTFSNIHATIPIGNGPTDLYIVNNCYQSPWGAAIYANYAWMPNQITNHGNVVVSNTTQPLTSNIHHCDKAVVCVGPNATVTNQFVQNCLLGMMNHSPYVRNFVINDNKIEGGHMGIQLFGRHKKCDILTNNIYVNTVVSTGIPGLINNFVPIGIKMEYSAAFPINAIRFRIEDNPIVLHAKAGVGIYNAFADRRMLTKNNTIHFTTTNTGLVSGYNIKTLMGLWSDNCVKSEFDENNVHGLNNLSVYQNRNSYGLYIDNSPWCKWTCNKADYIRYGFYIWGNNETDDNKVANNRFDANEHPWFFLDGPGTTASTFGDIGNNNANGYDNGNVFEQGNNWMGNLGINPGAFKVFRYSNVQPNKTIYTDLINLLGLNESGASGASSEYQVVNNPNGYSNPCQNFNANIMPPNDSNYLEYAISVAEDSTDYINYSTVGSWMDQYRLYSDLDIDSVLRNSDPSLLTFYNSQSTTNIGYIRDAEVAINKLYDSTTTAANFAQRYAGAVSANNMISSGDDWEMNEKSINEVMIATSNTPFDSIPQAMKETIGELAFMCPFVGGNAVYKARTLWSYWQPNALFDDRVICMQGQNKNLDNTDIDLDSLYASQIKENYRKSNIPKYVNRSEASKEKLLEPENGVIIYPNPTNETVTISYNERKVGRFELYNNLGQVLLNTTLPAGKSKVNIVLENIPAGIYYYKCLFEKSYIGKLTIINKL